MEAWRGTCYAMVMILVIGIGEGQLAENFYSSSCPNVESIVNQTVSTKFNQTFVTIPATLRLFFHDCFVEAGGPSFNVELGRLDGLISKASNVPGNLPEPFFNLDQLNALFAKNNLTQLDMIALSGAHTLGFSHCSRFANRLYNFSTSSQVDPSLNTTYSQQLMQGCPQNVDPRIAVDFDPVTPQTFDNVYYKNLVAGMGLLTSDEVLFTNPASQPTVNDFANNPNDFNAAFVTAMRKLGRCGVKTGSQGEIRKDCTAFNS
ncbi:hypothetical protein C3L33_19119, partial [Rhododendron williamsianum]